MRRFRFVDTRFFAITTAPAVFPTADPSHHADIGVSFACMFATIVEPSVQIVHGWKQMGAVPFVIIFVLHDAPQKKSCSGFWDKPEGEVFIQTLISGCRRNSRNIAG
jgi:hypothetical protein